MPIPDTALFNDCLSSLHLSHPASQEEYEYFEVAPARFLSDKSRMLKADAVVLWHPKSCQLAPTRIAESICKELRYRRHFSTPDIGGAFLAMLYLTSSTDGTPVNRLNKLLEGICSAEASAFLIAPFPPHPASRPFQLGRFSIGRLRRDRLEYRSRRVGCDFFDRYPQEFLDRFAIEASPMAVQALDWPKVREELRIPATNIGGTIVDYYFERLTINLQEMFCYDFRVEQEVLVAAGAPYLDLNRPQAWNGGTFVAIFQNIGRSSAGYFCPLGMGVGIDFAQADIRLPAKSKELEQTFSFHGLSTAELHVALGTYCRFLVRAKVHESEGRYDEAFLHHVIALDLLFGDKEASTQKVTRRTAIVVAKALGLSYPDALARIRDLYDRRSRYVHAGQNVGDDQLDAVSVISTKVLHCLLRLQSNAANMQSGFIANWIKTLDFIAAATEAQKELPNAELIAAGLAIESNDRDVASPRG